MMNFTLATNIFLFLCTITWIHGEKYLFDNVDGFDVNAYDTDWYDKEQYLDSQDDNVNEMLDNDTTFDDVINTYYNDEEQDVDATYDQYNDHFHDEYFI
uniref:Hypotheticial protein n=1 Tax=Schistosoma japonicum TaxID=6182 RepID=C1L4G7_SCHJA|nr:hypotheticial protein [Schistosoma japonicum]